MLAFKPQIGMWVGCMEASMLWSIYQLKLFSASSDRGRLPGSENAAVRENASRACLPERLKQGRTALPECIAFQIPVMMNRTKASYLYATLTCFVPADACSHTSLWGWQCPSPFYSVWENWELKRYRSQYMANKLYQVQIQVGFELRELLLINTKEKSNQE